MSDWNPSLYLHFAAERSRPAVELLARVPLENIKYVADLGCGPGNSTTLLHQRWPAARNHILKIPLTNYLQDYNINRCCMWHLLMIKAYRML